MLQLDADILLNICEEVDTSDLLALSLVSHQWRRAAQSVLFACVSLFDSYMEEGTLIIQFAHPVAIAERLHWLHQSVTMSPQLGSHIRFLSYQPIKMPGHFDKFAQVIQAAATLQELQLNLDMSAPFELEAQQYRTLFESVSFGEMIIYAPSLTCVMCVPTRRLQKLHITYLCSGEPATTSVDLADYRINAEEVQIRDFSDESFPGLGSSFWYASSLLAFCLHGLVRFHLINVPVSARRLHRLLRSIGQSLEHLSLRLWSRNSSGARLFNEQVTETYDWNSLLPRLTSLHVDFLSTSMASLQSVRHLQIDAVELSTCQYLRMVVALLQTGFSPDLKLITFRGNSIQHIIPISSLATSRNQPVVNICYEHRIDLDTFAGLIEQRRLQINPPYVWRALDGIVEARLLLRHELRTSATEHFEQVRAERTGLAGSNLPVMPAVSGLGGDDDNEFVVN